MGASVSDFLVRRLAAWGVRRVFGYPGDGINGVMGALARSEGRVRFIQATHEELAAFMACGHARFTGEAGICIATSGPGAIHVLNGLYDAKMDRQPVVAIVGQQPRSVLGGDYQQEVDLPTLFKDVAGEYVQTVTSAAQIRHVVDRAMRIALATRSPTCIILPSDVQELAAPDPDDSEVPTGIGYTAPRIVPTEADLRRAAEVLNAGEKVAILVGAGARDAAPQVVELADRLNAGIAKALLGKSVLSDDLPNVTGTLGLLGTRPSHELMTGCDTLLMVGSSFPYVEFLPRPGQARGVQVDIDARMLSLRYPMEGALQGDCGETLSALLPLVEAKGERGRPWREKIEAGVKEWWDTLEKRAMLEAKPLNPQRVFRDLSPKLPKDAMIATDTGSSVFWFARGVRMRPGMQMTHSGALASMGAALPYALAGKFAHPGRPALAFVGDGAMQMAGLNSLITVAKFWREWADPRFIVLVLNNRDLNYVTWEQRAMQGDPRFPDSQDVPDFAYARYAEGLGLAGRVVSSPGDVGPAWDEAFAADRPILVEAIVDPDVPLLPPHVTAEQARNYMKALARGDPDALRIVMASIRELMA